MWDDEWNTKIHLKDDYILTVNEFEVYYENDEYSRK